MIKCSASQGKEKNERSFFLSPKNGHTGYTAETEMSIFPEEKEMDLKINIA